MQLPRLPESKQSNKYEDPTKVQGPSRSFFNELHANRPDYVKGRLEQPETYIYLGSEPNSSTADAKPEKESTQSHKASV